MGDSASLQNLHDFVVPGPVAWWPPAPGWYAVFALAAATLLLLAWRGFRHWRRNRYRGEALRELAQICRSNRAGDLRKTPILLKRAALSAWPREQVAGLVGMDWYRFLDDSASTDRFCSGVGGLLDRLAYAPADVLPLSEQETAVVLEAAQHWLRQHLQR